jgi:hypothetical protein
VYGEEIETLQSKHADNLALSGKMHLDVLMREFEALGIWDDFMPLKTEPNEHLGESELICPRDATSGKYDIFNVRDRYSDAARSAKPVGEDAVVQTGN